MNVRTLTGWATHGHSGANCADNVYVYGPFEDEFHGHWLDFELGLKMSRIFDVWK